MMPSMIKAVNSVIGINDSHLITRSDNCTFEIITNGMIRVSHVTIPHKIIIVSICIVVVIGPSPPQVSPSMSML